MNVLIKHFYSYNFQNIAHRKAELWVFVEKLMINVGIPWEDRTNWWRRLGKRTFQSISIKLFLCSNNLECKVYDSPIQQY